MAQAAFDFNNHSHKRLNPLTNSWVLCSPHRTQRPWQGKREDGDELDKRPSYDPSCYLCPRNTRANGGMLNPDYHDTFVFQNDFPAVQQDQPSLVASKDSNPLLQVESVRGECHVICFSPEHDKTLADMTELQIRPVIDAWIDTYDSLKQKPHINHVQIFENKGAAMGCSNPHPHGQVWSTEDIPQEPAQELVNMARYRKQHSSCMLCDYVKTELETDLKAKAETALATANANGNATAATIAASAIDTCSVSEPSSPSSTSSSSGYLNEPLEPISTPSTTATTTTTTAEREVNGVKPRTTPDGSRIVCENTSFVCVVPFWATWPFETMVLPKQHLARLSDMDATQKDDLANILRRITCRYDNLFRCSFPYSMGIHQAPTNGDKDQEALSHLHLHFYPPLLRSATVRKFLVGFELLGQAQRDLTPEQAATRLAECSEVHYRSA
ncbi:hypothetical protein BGZ75_004841 [Mortierella antarctica]|nr:hypothetical protein BGZ75_004841 [Mortierella antarctica]